MLSDDAKRVLHDQKCSKRGGLGRQGRGSGNAASVQSSIALNRVCTLSKFCDMAKSKYLARVALMDRALFLPGAGIVTLGKRPWQLYTGEGLVKRSNGSSPGNLTPPRAEQVEVRTN